jgi:hypothetical protein
LGYSNILFLEGNEYMKITAFFAKILKAPLKNQRWSWGATDPQGRICLKVWDDQITNDKKKVRVGFIKKPPIQRHCPGVAERDGHIDSIRNRAIAFGVICVAEEAHADPSQLRHIKSFSGNLARLGAISVEQDIVYADITGSQLTRNL